VRAAPGPDPPGFEPVPHQGAVTRRFLAYSSPSRLPDPYHLAVLARPGFVRAAPAFPGITRVKLPSAPPSRCDENNGEGLSPPLESLRLTAHTRAASHPTLGVSQIFQRSHRGAIPPATRDSPNHRIPQVPRLLTHGEIFSMPSTRVPHRSFTRARWPDLRDRAEEPEPASAG
jgi:hypothetical protein